MDSKNHNSSLLSLKQIIGDKNANPVIPALVPVSRSTWWEGVKTKRYPAPVALGPRRRAWRASDIQSLIDHGVSK